MADDFSTGPVTYPEVLDLPPRQALRLGIQGTDPPANAYRRAHAEQIIAQATNAINRAYETAHWMSEPTMPEPSIAHILLRNDGDMVRAVQDPAMIVYLKDHMGLMQHVEPTLDNWSDDPQPILGKSQIIDPLREDPSEITDLRDAINSLRADDGVGPISEPNLRVAVGVDQSTQPAIEDLLEARSVSTIQRGTTERQNNPGVERDNPGFYPMF